MRRCRVIAAHSSEMPVPIEFDSGAILEVGEVYEGNEGWENWVMCRSSSGVSGWVPAQIIEVTEGGFGVSTAPYTSIELDVEEGQMVMVTKQLNGWCWCEMNGQSGWVPSRCIDV